MFDTDAPEVDDDESNDDIGNDHPPGEQPVALDGNRECTFLVADSSLGTDGLHMEGVAATTQILEGHTVSQGITIAPVFILTFHPVHELQTFTLVVVTSSKLDRESILVVPEYNFVGLVHRLTKNHTASVFMTCEHLFFADEHLCEHYTRQRVLAVCNLLYYPVYAVKTT